MEAGRTKGTVQRLCGLAVAPSGMLVASCSTDKTVKVWTPGSVVVPKPLYTHDGPVNSVAFSPVDGKSDLSGGDDKLLRLWNLRAAQEVSFAEHTDAVTDVAISPDGNEALSGSRDRTIKLWNLQNNKQPLRTFTGHEKGVAAVAFCNEAGDATVLVSGGRDKTVRLWRIDRADSYLKYEQEIADARKVLTRAPGDPSSLAVLGRWYAFRGVDSWAVSLLEEARSGGEPVQSLELARCYWNLPDGKAKARQMFQESLWTNARRRQST